MTFHADRDPIAITVPRVKLLKDSEPGVNRWNELYLVSVAVDEGGVRTPALHYNLNVFPRLKKGDEIEMLGDGYLVYGPANPGAFVAVSVLFVESDEDVRELGARISDALDSEGVETAMDMIAAAAQPTAHLATSIAKVALGVASRVLASSRDDQLFRIEGSYLRDRPTPFDINRRQKLANRFVEADLQVIPLAASNGQGPSPAVAQSSVAQSSVA